MMILATIVQGPDVIPPGAIEISEAFFATVAIIALGIPIIRAITRRLERGPSAAELAQQASPEVLTRLERIEQGVEAIAVEVERIAEAQRFSAKIMAEQQKRALPHADSTTQ